MDLEYLESYYNEYNQVNTNKPTEHSLTSQLNEIKSRTSKEWNIDTASCIKSIDASWVKWRYGGLKVSFCNFKDLVTIDC